MSQITEKQAMKAFINQCVNSSRRKTISQVLTDEDRTILASKGKIKLQKKRIAEYEREQKERAKQNYNNGGQRYFARPAFTYDPRYSQIENYRGSPAWYYSRGITQ